MILILFVIGILYLTMYPILFERDIEKVKGFLKKSNQAYYQFIYYLFDGDEEEAANQIQKIKNKQLKNINHVLLLTKQKKYEEAKQMLSYSKDNVYKWYYGAVIALEQGNKEDYELYKSKIKEPLYLFFLELEEMVKDGKKEQVIPLLNDKMKELRGLKLLTAAHYKKEIEDIKA